MREYGDYIRETKRLLMNYNKMKVAALNLTEEIGALEAALPDVQIGSVRYGEDGVQGGRGELTSTEAAAARRMRMEGRVAGMRERRDELERIMRRIDGALASLDEVERTLIRARYMDGVTWLQAALCVSYTERWAKVRGRKALRDVALMLFGVLMCPAQLKLYTS